MFEKFISKIVIKLLTTDNSVKESLKKELQHVLIDEANIKKFSEIARQESVEIVNSSLVQFEEKIEENCKNKIDEAIEINSPGITIDDFDTLQEQIDSQVDILENTIANNVTQTKKLLDLISRLENTEKQIKSLSDSKNIVSQIKSEYIETNKKTRADVAAIITKVKQDISDLEIRLDAFIDTISERIAEFK